MTILSGAEGCDLDQQPQVCKKIVSQLVPKALPVIAKAYNVESPNLCNAVRSDVCI